MGREAELPLVHAASGEAFEVASLWPALAAPFRGGAAMTPSNEGGMTVGLRHPDYEIVSEVGTGTLEIVTRPCGDLHELAEVHDAALARIVAAAWDAGALVLGYGMQPRTAATAELLTRKPRYRALQQVLGPSWLPFASTASDQCHVAVERHEAMEATDTVNLLTPMVIALTANSPVAGNADLGVCSGREAVMRATGLDTVSLDEGSAGTRVAARARHGMPEAPAHDWETHAARLLAHRTLIDVENAPLAGGSGCEWLTRRHSGELRAADGEVSDAAWEFFNKHEHYVWHSARPRPAHGTLEVRAACQQPVEERHASPALALGMVAGWRRVREAALAHLGGDLDRAWARCVEWHGRAAAHGLAAEAETPSTGLITDVLDACEEALHARGLGEEAHLAPLRRRAMKRESPAQRARQVFRGGGVEALVRHAAFPEPLEEINRAFA